MSHSTKTYPFTLDATLPRYIREGLVTTVSAGAAASTTHTLTSIKTLSVGQSVTFLTPATHAVQAGPVTITDINYSTNVITVSQAVTTITGDLVAKHAKATAQMVLGVHIVNMNAAAALVTFTSIDETITHAYFGCPANGTYSNEIEWLAPGGIKIAPIAIGTDVKVTVFAKNLG